VEEEKVGGIGLDQGLAAVMYRLGIDECAVFKGDVQMMGDDDVMWGCVVPGWCSICY
jgi:hypothetical protein